MFAAQHKVDNLIAFVDYNKQQLDDHTKDICDLGDLAKKVEENSMTVILARHPAEESVEMRHVYCDTLMTMAEKYIDVEDSLKKIKGHNSIIEALFSRNKERVIRALQEHLASFYNVGFTPVAGLTLVT